MLFHKNKLKCPDSRLTLPFQGLSNAALRAIVCLRSASALKVQIPAPLQLKTKPGKITRPTLKPTTFANCSRLFIC